MNGEMISDREGEGWGQRKGSIRSDRQTGDHSIYGHYSSLSRWGFLSSSPFLLSASIRSGHLSRRVCVCVYIHFGGGSNRDGVAEILAKQFSTTAFSGLSAYLSDRSRIYYPPSPSDVLLYSMGRSDRPGPGGPASPVPTPSPGWVHHF